MIRGLLLHFLLVSPFVVLAHDQPSTTSWEPITRRLGRPMDEWEITLAVSVGIRPERSNHETPRLQCRSGTQVIHPMTHTAECCQEDWSITWKDEEAELGFCCAPGHEWTGDIWTGEGGCCLKGLFMVDGRCTEQSEQRSENARIANHGGGCSSKHKHLSAPSHRVRNDDFVQWKTDVGYPEADGGPIDLGIRYGHCYLLNVPESNRQIGLNREDAVYAPGGLFQNIPFRVCRSTSDCSRGDGRGDADSTISSHSQFFLQDQIGRHHDPAGASGWVTRKNKGLTRMAFTSNAAEATGFFGMRDTTCKPGGSQSCSLRLGGLPLDLTFRESPCLYYDSGSDEL